MVIHKIYDEDGNGFYRTFSQEKVERVNPFEYFKKYEIEKRATVLRDTVSSKYPALAPAFKWSDYLKQAEESLEDFFEEFKKAQIQPNLEELLSTHRKKEQVRLLKGVFLTPRELTILILKAYEDHGYLFSKYSFKINAKILDGQQRPRLLELSDNNTVLKKIGATSLTEKQLKNLILLRRVIVANFFENEHGWHCFFITYESIAGRENHKNGQPHFHYISSGFGVTKENVIEGMRTGNYLSTPVHIDLLDYGVQPT